MSTDNILVPEGWRDLTVKHYEIAESRVGHPIHRIQFEDNETGLFVWSFITVECEELIKRVQGLFKVTTTAAIFQKTAKLYIRHEDYNDKRLASVNWWIGYSR